MNEIVSQFLLTGDRFMPEVHLRQSGFTYLLITYLLVIHLQKTKQVFEIYANRRYKLYLQE